jgi:hypothetical protein
MSRGSRFGGFATSATPLATTIHFQYCQEVVPGQASHERVGGYDALDADPIAVAGKDHFVSGLQSDRVAERFRDHDLPFAADTMSHTKEYNRSGTTVTDSWPVPLAARFPRMEVV